MIVNTYSFSQREQKLLRRNNIPAGFYRISREQSLRSKRRGIPVIPDRDIHFGFSIDSVPSARSLSLIETAFSLIPKDSALEFDARKRTRAFYLSKTRIPMLPSDTRKLGSLTPGRAKLALTFEIAVEPSGRIGFCG